MSGTTSGRTTLFTMYLAALMVLTAWLLDDHETVVGYTVLGLAFLAVPPAMRGSIGDLAAGGGLRGAAHALMTEAKPGEPAPATKPAKEAP